MGKLPLVVAVYIGFLGVADRLDGVLILERSYLP